VLPTPAWAALTILTISVAALIVNSVNIVYGQPMARYTETIYPVKKLVPLTSAMAEAISEYRHRQRISSENEAIRQLIEAGLSGQAAPTPERSSASEPGVDQAPEPVASKPSPPRKSVPRAKAAAMSKEAQIRALRERDTQ
jgi:hypothetical protein